MRKSIVLIDGEHYPPVNARAIAALVERGDNPVLALLIGGGEKLGQTPLEVGIPVEIAIDPERYLAAAIERTGATRVIDLSDDPVLGYVERCRMASIALWKGAEYAGADFIFSPPPRDIRPPAPSAAVIGTGKRTGKTAITGAAARAFKDAGLNPVVVAMGRGGPPEPEVIDGENLTPQFLLKWSEDGRHAAGDYIESAITAQVPAVGAWRAGGGIAGAPGFSNYERALEKAAGLDPGVLLLDGSGAAIPPARFDAAILAVNAQIDPGALCGYFGLYRLLLADLVVLTMVEQTVDREQLAALDRCIRGRPLDEPKVIHTVFRPHPLGDISRKKVWFATTARRDAGEILKRHLEEGYGARVMGISHSLADRDGLRADLQSAKGADVLAVEIKAAAVDVVTRFGLENSLEVVYVDNRPEVAGDGDLNKLLLEVAYKAEERHHS